MAPPSGSAAHEPGRRRFAALCAGPLLALAVLALPPPDAMPPAAWRFTALAAWMVVWWLGEAVPLAATSLLPIPLMPLLGVGEVRQVTASYAHPLIFLFLGGFLLAAAMQRWGLHRRIALALVAAAGTGPGAIVAGFMAATALLSMWISNTAATVMMYAVGLSVVGLVSARAVDAEPARRFGVALMLGIAYAASIGGVGTLIGTPPNAYLASFLSAHYGIRLDFVTWMGIGLPVVAVMLPIGWLLLTRLLFPVAGLSLDTAVGAIRGERAALGPLTRGERAVCVVFAIAAAGWILGPQLAAWTGLPVDDTVVAIAAVLLLFAWPVSWAERVFVLGGEAVGEVRWGVLLLFGGGLALAGGFRDTGLAAWIGGRVAGFEAETWLIVLAVTAAMVFLTELTSNTASTATFLPVLGAVAVGLGLDPRVFAVPVALAASMAFMMPVATPPNAIVFAYEGLRLPDMARAGLWMNLAAIAVTFAAARLLMPVVLGV